MDAAEREQLILDQARTRSGAGVVPAGLFHEVQVSSPTCGDRIDLRVAVLSGTVTGLGWDGRGCAISQASASVLARIAPGTPLARLALLRARLDAIVAGERLEDAELDALADGAGDLVAFEGLGRLPLRARCATLAWRALDEALADPAG